MIIVEVSKDLKRFSLSNSEKEIYNTIENVIINLYDIIFGILLKNKRQIMIKYLRNRHKNIRFQKGRISRKYNIKIYLSLALELKIR